MGLRLAYILCSYLIFAGNILAQTGELDRYDCTYSKEITFPFNYSENPNKVVKPQLNQVVFYTYRDQFTYWYKITSKLDGELSFKIAAINDSDSYVAYIYQYNETDFCNKLFYNKIKPLYGPYFIEKTDKTANPAVKTFTVKKDKVYYISVLNTSLNNCGHYFTLNALADTLKIKAYHSPCKKDVESLPVTNRVEAKAALPEQPLAAKNKKNEPVSIKNDTLKKEQIAKNTNPSIGAEKGADQDNAQKPPLTDTASIKPVTEKQKQSITDTSSRVSLSEKQKTATETPEILFIVKDKKKLGLLNAQLSVVFTDDREYMQLENTEIGRWKSLIRNKGMYSIKCAALGYKDLELTIDFTGENKVVELLLEPLTVGENFIMKSIYFHPNTYALRKESNNDLRNLLSFLIDNPDVVIEIQGHTNGDNKIFKNKAYEQLGEEWNFQGSSKKLSLYRAEAIKNYLISNGVEATRLVAKGMGGEKPIIKDPETMEEGQRNIRVEVQILKR